MVSLVAPVTNLLILPIIPFLTTLGLLSAVFGIFSNFLGWVFALPCYLMLSYFLKTLDVFYQPWAAILLPEISLIFVPIYYLILGFAIWFLAKKKKPEFLGY